MNSQDIERIQAALKEAIAQSKINPSEASALIQELRKAKAVEPKKVPATVVTMNSIVEIFIASTGKTMTIQVVYPEHADLKQNKISILSPIAAAIIGYRVGDEVSWTVPAGQTTIRIKKLVYQPEAAGDYSL